MANRTPLAVPVPVMGLLLVALLLQIALQTMQPAPVAGAQELPAPAASSVVRVASLDETIVAGQALTLYLQAFDNQPGVSIPFQHLDYARVIGWLDTVLALDAMTQYPLLMASQLYAQVPNEAKQRLMLDFVHARFLEDPRHRWRWLAHAAIMARHRLKDKARAVQYAADIARFAANAPGWARQMHIFMLEDMGELESATVLLGGLLATGEVMDPKEIHFLAQRLEQMRESVEISAPASRN